MIMDPWSKKSVKGMSQWSQWRLFAISFLADSVMKVLGYRALRMLTYYHISFSLSVCCGTPTSYLIYHNPLQTVITFFAVQLEKLWALHHTFCLAQFFQLFGTQQTHTFQNPKLIVDSWYTFHKPAFCMSEFSHAACQNMLLPVMQIISAPLLDSAQKLLFPF